MTQIDQSKICINIETGSHLGQGILDVVVYYRNSINEVTELRETFSSKNLSLIEFMDELNRMKAYLACDYEKIKLIQKTFKEYKEMPRS